VVLGVVFDSLAMAPLPEARVRLVVASGPATGQSFTATTDVGGQFRIDSLPPGSYIAGFEHRLLDSLGLEPGTRPVEIGGSQARVDLATPSVRTLSRLLCPVRATSADTTRTLLLGHVRHAETEEPLSNAPVWMEWQERWVDESTLRRRTALGQATTSPAGWFGICDVPMEQTLAIRAAHDGDSSGVIAVLVPRTGMLHVGLFVGPSEHRTIVLPRDSNAGSDCLASQSAPTVEVLRGGARLGGRVLTEAGSPLGGARVAVLDAGLEVVSEADGRFALDSLPAGSHMVQTLAVGYAPVEVPVRLAQRKPATVVIVLNERVAELPAVNVREREVRRGKLARFYERMRDAEKGINYGHFFTEEDIERRRAHLITQMFEGLPAVRVLREPGNPDYRRSYIAGLNGCPMTVYLDDIRILPTLGGHRPGVINDVVPPNHVAAIEIYPRPVSAPPRYQSLNGTCGVVVIWTK
jgi:hypothetical protein